MGYVDKIYYTDTYKGTLIPVDEIESYLEKASDEVDQLTYFRVSSRGFENLTIFQQAYIQKAVCAQAEHLYDYEDLIAAASLGGYSVGDVSVSLDKAKGVKYSSNTLNYLLATGLTYRGL